MMHAFNSFLIGFIKKIKKKLKSNQSIQKLFEQKIYKSTNFQMLFIDYNKRSLDNISKLYV